MTGWHHAKLFLVHLLFVCMAATVEAPGMLLLAFIGGFLWDANNFVSPHGGDPEVYFQPVESLRFGTSIILFGILGYLIQGIRPLFQQAHWWRSMILSGLAILGYLAVEFLLITFIRGEFIFRSEIARQIFFSAVFTMLFTPLIFWLLLRIASACDHLIVESTTHKKRRQLS